MYLLCSNTVQIIISFFFHDHLSHLAIDASCMHDGVDESLRVM